MTILRKTGLTIAAMALLSSASLQAEDDGNEEDGGDGVVGSFGGSAMLASDYRFRGISNSNEEPQVQVDFNWSHPVGFYTGVWSSNTDFGGAGNSMELDPYIGFARGVGDTEFSYNVGFWAYTFPGSEADLNFNELYAIGTWTRGRLSISPSVWYAHDYFGDDFLPGVPGLAFDGTIAWQFPRDYKVSGRAGKQTFGSGGDQFDYIYWDVGVSKALGDWSFGMRWHDTSSFNPNFIADQSLAEGDLVLSVTRSF